jgi:1-acyl-sn-glycerol-3-phosphate acyltransferase
VKRGYYGSLMVFVQNLVRLRHGRHEVRYSSDPPVPSVYIVHHQNLQGPVTALAWLDTNLHMWTLNVFFTPKECFAQYTGYTFTKRFGLPRFLAAAIAFPASRFIPALLHSCQAIPVYRDSTNIRSTMRQTLAALRNGENILISPDIDYTSTSPAMGEMYEGFLHIERFFHLETGAHVAFVPVHVDRSRHLVIVGNAIRFPGTRSFRHEKDEVYARIRAEFARLEQPASGDAD